jgi:hypothetical protein
MGVKRLSFVKSCAVAGTPERVVLPANDIRTRAYTIQAQAGNTGFIRVGGSDVSLTNGAYLEEKDSAVFSNIEHQDTEAESVLSDVWLVASVSGESAIIIYDLGEDLDS